MEQEPTLILKSRKKVETRDQKTPILLSTTMSETLSLPSLLFATLLLFLIARYFLSPSSSSRSADGRRRQSSSTFPGARRVDASKVEQVAQMFPQLDRRAIAWDLARNGGSVGATTERVLGGRGLDAVSSFPCPAERNGIMHDDRCLWQISCAVVYQTMRYRKTAHDSRYHYTSPSLLLLLILKEAPSPTHYSSQKTSS